MPESVSKPEVESAPAPSQSGMQIWIVCALFIAVPVLLILVVKYLLGG